MRRSIVARLVAPIVLLILASALGASCGDDDDETASSTPTQDGVTSPTGSPLTGEPILIGMVTPTTGPGGETAKGQPIVAQAAIDDVNASGGVNGRPLELVHLDDGTDPQKTVTAFTDLVGQNVVAVLGPQHSGGALAIKPISFENKMPTLTWGSNPAITEPPENDYIFQMIETTDTFVERIFQYIQADIPEAKKIALLHDATAYGQGAADGAQRLATDYGLEIVGNEAYQLTDTDMTVQLTKLKGADADILIVWGFGPSMAIAVRNVDELGFDIPILGAPGVAEPANLESAGASADGIRFVSGICADEPLPGPQTTLIDLWATLSSDPFLSTYPYPWDAVHILAEALETVMDQGGDIEDGDAVAAALEEATTGGYEGAEGLIDWSTRHGGPLPESALICEVDGGKQVVRSGRVNP